MSGIYVYHFPEGADASVRRGYQERAIADAVRRTSDRNQASITDRTAAAGLFHDISSRAGGVVASADRRHTLALCGLVWLKDEDTSLATTQSVLSHLTENDFTDEHRLRGQYSFVLCDDQSGRVVAESDPFGVYPLYYRELPDGIAVASEIKALTFCGPNRLCMEALGEVVRFGYVVSDLTLIEGVRRLLPGTRLHYQSRRLRLERLRRVLIARNREPTPDVYEQVHAAFERNLKRSIAGREASAFATLSGGMDSRLIVLALKALDVDFTAWSSGEEDSLERRVAGDYAQMIGVPFSSATVDGARFPDWCEQAIWITEGRCPLGHAHFLDPLIGNAFPRSGLCAHGLIGDVVMGGDMEPKTWQDSDDVEARCREHMKRIVYWPVQAAERTLSAVLLDAYHAAEERAASSLFERFSSHDAYSNLIWFRYDFRLHGFVIPCLMSQVLPWADPVVPYIDPQVFALCAGISRSAIVERKFQISFATKYYPQTFGMPHVKDGVLVSWQRLEEDHDRGWRRLHRLNQFRYLVGRLSRGRVNLPARESYPAYEQWYRRERSVRQFVDDALLSDFSGQLGVWQPEGLRRLLTDQRIGRNVWGAVGALLSATLFARQFIAGEDRPGSVLT